MENEWIASRLRLYTETMRASRTHISMAVVALGLLSAARPASAQPDEIAGSYEVAFDAVADNCDADGLSLDESQLIIESRGEGRLVARIPGVPAMSGTERRGGQFRAEVRSSDSAVDDSTARYSIAGRARGGQVRLVFIVEYYRSDKPLCTQSWSGSGSAGEGADQSEEAGPREARAGSFSA